MSTNWEVFVDLRCPSPPGPFARADLSLLLQDLHCKLTRYQVTLTSPCVPDDSLQQLSEQIRDPNAGPGTGPVTRTTHHYSRVVTVEEEETRIVVTDDNGSSTTSTSSYSSTPRDIFSMCMGSEDTTPRGSTPPTSHVAVAHIYIRSDEDKGPIARDISTCISNWMRKYCEDKGCSQPDVRVLSYSAAKQCSPSHT